MQVIVAVFTHETIISMRQHVMTWMHANPPVNWLLLRYRCCKVVRLPMLSEVQGVVVDLQKPLEQDVFDVGREDVLLNDVTWCPPLFQYSSSSSRVRTTDST